MPRLDGGEMEKYKEKLTEEMEIRSEQVRTRAASSRGRFEQEEQTRSS